MVDKDMHEKIPNAQLSQFAQSTNSYSSTNHEPRHNTKIKHYAHLDKILSNKVPTADPLSETNFSYVTLSYKSNITLSVTQQESLHAGLSHGATIDLEFKSSRRIAWIASHYFNENHFMMLPYLRIMYQSQLISEKMKFQEVGHQKGSRISATEKTISKSKGHDMNPEAIKLYNSPGFKIQFIHIIVSLTSVAWVISISIVQNESIQEFQQIQLSY